MNDVKIEIRGLCKFFQGRRVLDGVNLDVREGQTLVIIGRSGCGKSVLLRNLLGLVTPDKGTIRIDGQEMTPATRYAMRLQFGMLFQHSALFDSMNVEENVAFAMVEHSRMTSAQIAARVDECLEMVGLKGIQKRMPSELSGGMRKRVALARAVSMKPKVLLFDEPTTGLDPLTADAINHLMIQLRSILKTTCVVVTHDMSSAYKVGDQISMLHEGSILVSGTPAQIRSDPDPIVRSFVEGSIEIEASAARSAQKPSA